MRRTISYLLIFAVLLGSLYLGWRVTQPELTGHWHMVKSLGTDNSKMQGVDHFNVYANGEVHLEEATRDHYFMTGTVNRLAKQMSLGGECWYVHANYDVSGNKMKLYGEGYDGQPWHGVAIKTVAGDCDPERDYFSALPFAMRLPTEHAGRLEQMPTYPFDQRIEIYIGEGRGRWSSPMIIGGVAIGSGEDLSKYMSRWMVTRTPDSLPLRLIVYQHEEANATALIKMLQDYYADHFDCEGYYQVFRQRGGVGELEFGVRWVAW